MESFTSMAMTGLLIQCETSIGTPHDILFILGTTVRHATGTSFALIHAVSYPSEHSITVPVVEKAASSPELQ